jgi:hypothetical protein
MTSSFTKQVAEYTEQYRKRLDFAAKASVMSVVNDAQKSAAKGGNMSVDTDFLLKSIVASTQGMPSGPDKPDNNIGPIGSNGKNLESRQVTAEIAKWKPGVTPLWIGWAAAYARAMEYRYGYMRGAIGRWQEFANKAVLVAKRRKL